MRADCSGLHRLTRSDFSKQKTQKTKKNIKQKHSKRECVLLLDRIGMRCVGQASLRDTKESPGRLSGKFPFP